MQTFGRHAPVDCLKSIDHFRDYTKAQRREVTRLAEHVKVGEGEILVREGQVGKELFLILSGAVEVTQKSGLFNTLGPWFRLETCGLEPRATQCHGHGSLRSGRAHHRAA